MSEDVRAVEVANTAFYNAVESADLDLLAAVWVDGGDGPNGVDATCVHPGWPALRGRTEVLRSFAVILANTPYLQFFLTDVEVRIAGDAAIVTGVENILTGLEGDADGGGALSGGRVISTNVYRRTPRGWRMWVRHASPVLDDEDGDEDPDAEDVR